jgi:hypothetical protein
VTRLKAIPTNRPKVMDLLEAIPGYWTGRAGTRRSIADDLRTQGNDKGADHCLMLASEYEAMAQKVGGR